MGDLQTVSMLGRRPVLDGIRGVAIGLVLARHALPGVFGGAGFTGVGLFFVLSGFLITTLLLEERAETGRVSLGRFYMRRALRLLPALYAMLAVYALIALLLAPRDAIGEILNWLGSTAVYLTPFAQWGGAAIAPGLGVVWSLAVEEYFYFLWPLLFVVLLSKGAPRWLRLVIPSMLIVVVIAARSVTWFAFGSRIYEMPWTWIDSLLAGCLVAMLWKSGVVRHVPRSLQWTAFVLLAGLSLVPNAKESAAIYLFGLLILALCGAIIVSGAVLTPIGIWSSVLQWEPLRWLGKRSYAIYLWNAIFLSAPKPFEIPRLLEVSIGLVLTMIIAELSFRFVEQPALRMKKRFERPRRRSSTGMFGALES